LMIMVVMVGMSVAFSYVVFYADNYKAGIGSSVLESLAIEDVWVKQDYTSVQVSVYNVATQANLGTDVNLNVTAIYIDGSALINIRGSPNPSSLDYNPNYQTINFAEQPVKAGMHITFTCQSTKPLGSGTHDITITTLRGSNIKAQFDVA